MAFVAALVLAFVASSAQAQTQTPAFSTVPEMTTLARTERLCYSQGLKRNSARQPVPWGNRQPAHSDCWINNHAALSFPQTNTSSDSVTQLVLFNPWLGENFTLFDFLQG
jgi:hypothetical protein